MPLINVPEYVVPFGFALLHFVHILQAPTRVLDILLLQHIRGKHLVQEVSIFDHVFGIRPRKVSLVDNVGLETLEALLRKLAAELRVYMTVFVAF